MRPFSKDWKRGAVCTCFGYSGYTIEDCFRLLGLTGLYKYAAVLPGVSANACIQEVGIVRRLFEICASLPELLRTDGHIGAYRYSQIYRYRLLL